MRKSNFILQIPPFFHKNTNVRIFVIFQSLAKHEENPRILVCTPSNAAIDGLLVRLLEDPPRLEQNSSTRYKKHGRFRIIRKEEYVSTSNKPRSNLSFCILQWLQQLIRQMHPITIFMCYFIDMLIDNLRLKLTPHVSSVDPILKSPYVVSICNCLLVSYILSTKHLIFT